MSYYVFTSTSLGNADEVMENFLHIYNGDRLPYTATASGTITATDNTVDLGSSVARWRTLYCGNIITTLGAITAPYMWILKTQVVLSSTASSIEFTGLNGDNADYMQISISSPQSYTAGTYYLGYLNNDSATNYYNLRIIFQGTTDSVEGSATAWLMQQSLGDGLGTLMLATKTGKQRTCFYSLISHPQAKIGSSSWSNTSSTITSFKLVAAGTTTAIFRTGTSIKIWSTN
mgnify:CR=1 FL=1